MPIRRTEKQAKRFCLASPQQLPLKILGPADTEPIVLDLPVSKTCASCDIGAHEHCTGNCDCCGKDIEPCKA